MSMIKPIVKDLIHLSSWPIGCSSVPWAVCLAAALLIFVAGTTCAVAGESHNKTDQQNNKAQLSAAQHHLLKKLKKIDKRSLAIKDLTADYKQLRYSPLLKKPLVTHGKLLARPPVVLWASEGKNPVKMRINDKTLRILYLKPNVEEVYPIDSRLAALAASPLPELSATRKLFIISKGKISDLPAPPKGVKILVIRLEPKGKKLAKHVDHVQVMLDVKNGVIMAMEIVNVGGGKTIMLFSKIKMNTGLKDKQLKLNAPEDVKVVYPLKGKNQNNNDQENQKGNHDGNEK